MTGRESITDACYVTSAAAFASVLRVAKNPRVFPEEFSRRIH